MNPQSLWRTLTLTMNHPKPLRPMKELSLGYHQRPLFVMGGLRIPSHFNAPNTESLDFQFHLKSLDKLGLLLSNDF
ncbi:hypothetical protein J6590_080834 [Homalodisca vitripennis]|nr:hypothetical protein J6590_080834 [Homalodisca vitripennis]